MFKRMTLALALLALVSSPGLAAAQDDPRLGIVAATGATIGVEWRLSDKIALRPEVGFNFASTDSEDDIAGTSNSAVTFGVSALVTAKRWNDLFTYFAPRVTIGHSTSKSDAAEESLSVEASTTAYTFGGSFGAHYTLGDRFAVFGEAGLAIGVSHSEITSRTVLDTERTTTSVGTRTAVGIVFYF
jgi:hypothetical protein